MATYEITAPSGEVFEVTAPDTASQEEVLAYAQQQFAAQQQPEQRTIPEQVARQVGLTGRGAITGATSIPAMFGDVVALGMTKAGQPFGLPPAKPLSQMIQEGMTAIGVPQPETAGERAVQAGVSAMTGVGAEAAAAQALSKASTKVASLLAPLTKNLGRQEAIAMTSAPAAQVAIEKVADMGGNELAQTVTALAAGLLTGGVTNKFVPKGRPTPTTIEEVRQAARNNYKQLDSLDVKVNRNSLGRIFSNLQRNLIDEFSYNPNLPKFSTVKNELETIRKAISKQEQLSMQDLESIRQGFSKSMGETTDASTKEMFRSLINSMDIEVSRLKDTDFSYNVKNADASLDAIKEARKGWKLSSKAQIVQDLIDAAVESARDPKASKGEILRRSVITLLKNKQKMKQFSPDEVKALRQVANSGKADSLLSLAGRFNPERSQITAVGAAGAGVYGATTGNLLPLAISALGYAADKTQTALRMKAASDLVSGLAAGDVRVTPTAAEMLPRTAMEVGRVMSQEAAQ